MMTLLAEPAAASSSQSAGKQPEMLKVADIMTEEARPCLVYATQCGGVKSPTPVCRAHRVEWPCCMCCIVTCCCHDPSLPCVLCPDTRRGVLYILIAWHDESVIERYAREPAIAYPVKVVSEEYLRQWGQAQKLAKNTFSYMVNVAMYYLQYIRKGHTLTSADLALLMASSDGEKYLKMCMVSAEHWKNSKTVADCIRATMRLGGFFSKMDPNSLVFTSRILQPISTKVHKPIVRRASSPNAPTDKTKPTTSKDIDDVKSVSGHKRPLPDDELGDLAKMRSVLSPLDSREAGFARSTALPELDEDLMFVKRLPSCAIGGPHVR